MNKTVKLVNEWGDFEAKPPAGDIDDFCRYYLAKRQEKKIAGPLVGGVIGGLVSAMSNHTSWPAAVMHWWAGDGIGALVVGAAPDGAARRVGVPGYPGDAVLPDPRLCRDGG